MVAPCKCLDQWSAGASVNAWASVLNANHPALRIIVATVSPAQRHATLGSVFESVEQQVLSDAPDFDRIPFD